MWRRKEEEEGVSFLAPAWMWRRKEEEEGPSFLAPALIVFGWFSGLRRRKEDEGIEF